MGPPGFTLLGLVLASALSFALVPVDATSATIAKAKAKAPFTVAYLYNQNNYKNVPAKLKPGLVTFPLGSTCLPVPRAFQRNVQSIKINFALVAAGGASKRRCTQVEFYTTAGCKGFGIVFPKPLKGTIQQTPVFPGPFATKVISVACK